MFCHFDPLQSTSAIENNGTGTTVVNPVIGAETTVINVVGDNNSPLSTIENLLFRPKMDTYFVKLSRVLFELGFSEGLGFSNPDANKVNLDLTLQVIPWSIQSTTGQLTTKLNSPPPVTLGDPPLNLTPVGGGSSGYISDAGKKWLQQRCNFMDRRRPRRKPGDATAILRFIRLPSRLTLRRPVGSPYTLSVAEVKVEIFTLLERSRCRWHQEERTSIRQTTSSA